MFRFCKKKKTGSNSINKHLQKKKNIVKYCKYEWLKSKHVPLRTPVHIQAASAAASLFALSRSLICSIASTQMDRATLLIGVPFAGPGNWHRQFDNCHQGPGRWGPCCAAMHQPRPAANQKSTGNCRKIPSEEKKLGLNTNITNPIESKVEVGEGLVVLQCLCQGLCVANAKFIEWEVHRRFKLLHVTCTIVPNLTKPL